MTTDSVDQSRPEVPLHLAPRAGIGEVVVAELEEISRRRGVPK